MRAPRNVLGALLTLTVLATAHVGPVMAQSKGPASSGDDPARQDARAIYAQGVEHLSKGRVSEALAALERSYALSPSPNSSLLIARCLRQLDRLPEALSRYETAEREGRGADEARYAETIKSASTEAAEVRALVGVLRLRVVNAPPGTALEIDGEPSPLGSEGALRVVKKPGVVAIGVAPPTGAKVRQTATLLAGGEVDLTIDLAHAPPPPPSGPAIAPPAERPRWALPAAAVAGGVGVVGVALFAGFGLSSRSTYDALDDQCGGHCGTASEKEDADAGRRDQAIANVSLVVGAVGLAAGAILAVVGWPRGETSAKSSVRLGPGGAALRARF